MPNLTEAQRAALDTVLAAGPKVRRLTDSFAKAGYELYLVGGSVRDAILGRLGNDLDYTTSARPDEIEVLVRKVTKAVWDVGRAFGTIACRITEDDGTDWLVEITTFRADTYSDHTRKPEVAFGDHLGGDLVRRDFTVNAMALRTTDGELLDPFGGMSDLVAEVIRTPAAAELSFSDDPLRMLRAARFASQLGFVPAPEVVTAMRAMAPRLEIISAERIRDELVKLLLTDDPRPGLNLLVHTGIADVVLPELPALRMERDEHNRHKDVYEHTLTVIEQAIALERARGHQPDLINRLAALFHDIGKPRTRRFEADGKVSFHHHDVVGAKLTRKRMQALHFSNEEIKAVAKLVELHLRFHGYGDGQWTDSAVRRYVRDAGAELEHLHILTRSDCTTRNVAKATRLRRAYEELEWRIDELAAQEELDSMRPDLDGTQIMALLGIGPSPVVGEAYKFLLERRIEDGPLGPERAEQELLDWWSVRNA
ncbi:MAG TPA: CCA tRNA nucleotidyltransferase [Propionicimonas sp.]|nr:CCA tRNA nucleotidyltransferase [Propionicimonas sp.]HQD97761.1 CCA tRNA nucleotidyltransferase [Propionicimonas sp.]